MAYDLIEIGMLAIATGTISVTLANSHLTKPMRLRIIDHPLIGELASCGFCLSFWVSLVLSIINYGHLDVLAWLTAWGLGALWSGLLLKLYLFRESENEDLRDLIREMRETVEELLHGEPR